jgi:benzoate membrane transport protein
MPDTEPSNSGGNGQQDQGRHQPPLFRGSALRRRLAAIGKARPADPPPVDTASPRHGGGFWSDLSPSTFAAGLLVALAGYASSVAIVVQGLVAVGATTAQVTSALVGLAFAKGLVAIGLSLWTRMPISIAWTTPGLALLATTGAGQFGFPAAVGAFIVAALLVIIAAFWGPLARAVAAIPGAIANAMLAGILLKLCLAPFAAIGQAPATAALVLVTWLVVLRLARLYAVPAAVTVALIATIAQSPLGGSALAAPSLTFVAPAFTWEAMIGIALPLFVVTMASQNIPGFAVLATFGFRPKVAPALATTGLASLVTAPLGAPTVNMAAITAALCAGPDAHPDPARRYPAAVIAGFGYIALGGLAGITANVVTRSPPVLIEAVAGLALIGALGGALFAAVKDEAERLPAVVTFLVAASGLSLFGIGAAFWALVIGWAVHVLLKPRG